MSTATIKHRGDAELKERALRLYRARPNPRQRWNEEPHHRNVIIHENGGHRYVVVQSDGYSNSYALAVFRVRSDGRLKRLRRFPLSITT